MIIKVFTTLRRGILSVVGDILNTMGMFSTVGEFLGTMGDILNTVGDVQ